MSTKHVLITGAGGGVGGATVEKLDSMGWQVFAGVRSEEAGQTLTRGLSSGVTPVLVDICDEGSIARAREEVERVVDGAGLDGLINLAGLSVDGPVETLPLSAWRQQFEVNVFGQIAVIQAFLPLLRRSGGRIVNMGGAAGRMSLPMHGALSASKGALDSMTDALRMELKYQGVQVIYIEPGALGTELFRRSAEAAASRGYRGDEQVRLIYGRAMEAAGHALEHGRKSPVDHAVKAITNALTARRPAVRYIVGTEAKMGLRVLLRMPVGIRDRVLMSSFGLKSDVFRTTGG
jgi:NAD(P)-dependent dehydrogenase (short-subunit alcohol dehydrogenase family)